MGRLRPAGRGDEVKVVAPMPPKAIVADSCVRVSRWRVVSHDDLFAFDPYDGFPGNECMWFLSTDAEVLEPGTVSDTKTGDPKVGGGKLAAEVVAAAEGAPRFGYDLAVQER
jgi:hypothetical protein